MHIMSKRLAVIYNAIIIIVRRIVRRKRTKEKLKKKIPLFVPFNRLLCENVI